MIQYGERMDDRLPRQCLRVCNRNRGEYKCMQMLTVWVCVVECVRVCSYTRVCECHRANLATPSAPLVLSAPTHKRTLLAPTSHLPTRHATHSVALYPHHANDSRINLRVRTVLRHGAAQLTWLHDFFSRTRLSLSPSYVGNTIPCGTRGGAVFFSFV